MANHASAKKAARQSLVRNERNRAIRSSCRSLVNKTREAIAADKPAKDKIAELLKTTESALRKAASKGIYKRETVGRLVGRLNSAAAQKA